MQLNSYCVIHMDFVKYKKYNILYAYFIFIIFSSAISAVMQEKYHTAQT